MQLIGFIVKNEEQAEAVANYSCDWAERECANVSKSSSHRTGWRARGSNYRLPCNRMREDRSLVEKYPRQTV
jgi:hypothetical protein